MVTNEEIEQMKGVVRKCIYGIPDSEGQVARDTLDKIVAELLTLREAVAPQMAEVDALVDPWVGQPFVEIIGKFRNMRYLTRTAILACEREKQRADELTTELDRMDQKCVDLTTQLSAIRDAGDEEVNGAANMIYLSPEAEVSVINHLRDIAISRGQQLRERDAEIERWKKRVEWIGSCYKDDANGKSLVIFDGTKSATYPDDAQTIAQMIDNAMTEGCDVSEGLLTTKQQIQSLQSQIESLTAERDGLLERQKTIRGFGPPETEELRQRIHNKTFKLKCVHSVHDDIDRVFEIVANTRIEQDEARELLEHILSCIITVRQENTPEWMEYIVEEVNKVNEAMDDPDRVALSLGGIVIVKGESEIVEGNHA